MISRAEPPELQIRIRFVTVVPDLTTPKSITGFGSQPPSSVEMEMLAIGTVLALPVIKTYLLPPLVQISNMFEYCPVWFVLKFTGTTSDCDGLTMEFTAGRLLEVSPGPRSAAVALVQLSESLSSESKSSGAE